MGGLEESTTTKKSPVRRAIILTAIGACALALVYLTPIRQLFLPSSIEAARARVEELGALGPIAFVLVAAAALAVGAPRLWFAALGGLAFGWIEGLILAEISTMIGSYVTFRAARFLGRDFVAARLGDRLPRLDALVHGIEGHGVLANVLIRCQPVGNCFAVNLLMGVTAIPQRDFLLGTLLGTLPETVIYALFGSSAAGRVAVRVTGGLGLLALLVVGITCFSRRHGAVLRTER